MKKKFNRVYHNHLKCEEYNTNMWKSCNIKQITILKNQSIELLSNPDALYDSMFQVINNWIYSCENNLTASTINHQAWLGAAACAINHNCPEDITKLAWRNLTESQQYEANLIADKIITIWSNNYAKIKS
jgi:hypothetical protein